MTENINESFKATIASDEAMSLAKDYAEIGLDAILKDGLLKDIPIVGTLLGIYKIGSSLKDRHFLKKLLVFFGQSSDIPREERIAFLSKWSDDERYRETVGEKILLLIERLDETTKAEIIGKLFRLVVMEVIDNTYFLRLSGIVERALLYDLLALHYHYSWYDRDWEGEKPYKIDRHNEPTLAAFGLMQLEIGSKPSALMRASGINNSGLTDPTLEYKVSHLGQDLANLMLYDPLNPDIQKHFDERRREQSNR